MRRYTSQNQNPPLAAAAAPQAAVFGPLAVRQTVTITFAANCLTLGVGSASVSVVLGPENTQIADAKWCFKFRMHLMPQHYRKKLDEKQIALNERDIIHKRVLLWFNNAPYGEYGNVVDASGCRFDPNLKTHSIIFRNNAIETDILALGYIPGVRPALKIFEAKYYLNVTFEAGSSIAQLVGGKEAWRFIIYVSPEIETSQSLTNLSLFTNFVVNWAQGAELDPDKKSEPEKQAILDAQAKNDVEKVFNTVKAESPNVKNWMTVLQVGEKFTPEEMLAIQQYTNMPDGSPISAAKAFDPRILFKKWYRNYRILVEQAEQLRVEIRQLYVQNIPLLQEKIRHQEEILQIVQITKKGLQESTSVLTNLIQTDVQAIEREACLQRMGTEKELNRQRQNSLSIISQIRNALTCPICHELALLPKVVGECGHIACESCLAQRNDHIAKTYAEASEPERIVKRCCPVSGCQVLSMANGFPVLALKNLISLLVSSGLIAPYSKPVCNAMRDQKLQAFKSSVYAKETPALKKINAQMLDGFVTFQLANDCVNGIFTQITPQECMYGVFVNFTDHFKFFSDIVIYALQNKIKGLQIYVIQENKQLLIQLPSHIPKIADLQMCTFVSINSDGKFEVTRRNPQAPSSMLNQLSSPAADAGLAHSSPSMLSQEKVKQSCLPMVTEDKIVVASMPTPVFPRDLDANLQLESKLNPKEKQTLNEIILSKTFSKNFDLLEVSPLFKKLSLVYHFINNWAQYFTNQRAVAYQFILPQLQNRMRQVEHALQQAKQECKALAERSQLLHSPFAMEAERVKIKEEAIKNQKLITENQKREIEVLKSQQNALLPVWKAMSEILSCPVCTSVVLEVRVLNNFGHIVCHSCFKKEYELTKKELSEKPQEFSTRKQLLAHRCPMSRKPIIGFGIPVLPFQTMASILIENRLIKSSDSDLFDELLKQVLELKTQTVKKLNSHEEDRARLMRINDYATFELANCVSHDLLTTITPDQWHNGILIEFSRSQTLLFCETLALALHGAKISGEEGKIQAFVNKKACQALVYHSGTGTILNEEQLHKLVQTYKLTVVVTDYGQTINYHRDLKAASRAAILQSNVPENSNEGYRL